MDRCLPRGWRPILRGIRPPTEWVKASHPQVQGRPTGHRHHRRRHIEPMGRVKRVGMMTTWECQRRCYWLTAAVYVVSTSSLNILLSCTKSNRIWVSNTSSAFFSDPDKTYLESWALSFISMMTELNIKTQKRVSSFKWLPYYGIFSLKELFCKTSIYVSMEICLYRSKWLDS